MKLVFVNPTGMLGGAEMCLLDLLAALRADRPAWSSRVILGDDGPLRGATEALGVPCEVLPLPPVLAGLGDAGLGRGAGKGRGAAALALLTRGPAAALATLGHLRRLSRVLRDAAPDVVQTNGMKAHLLGTWAAPTGIPVVWHMHDFLGGRALMARLLRASARHRARRGGVRVVGVSRAVAEDAASILGPGVTVDAIHNAVDLDRFSPGPADPAWLDEAAGLPPPPAGTARIGLVATYARWKGHEVFLEAVARMPSDVPARFYVVGGPIYRSAGSQYRREELEARAAALGLGPGTGGRLGFVGHCPEPENVFRSLDVVVHASTRPEPFGRVIVEAMACGRAVVAARGGGAVELFEDGQTALGCPPGDPAVLAETLARLARDADLRRALGEAGRRSVEARFDRARLAVPWSRVYGAGIDDAPGSRAWDPALEVSA